jgi:hypothetical protein
VNDFEKKSSEVNGVKMAYTAVGMMTAAFHRSGTNHTMLLGTASMTMNWGMSPAPRPRAQKYIF